MLVTSMKMAARTVRRSKSKGEGKGSSVKRRPKRKSQKGGFIFTPYFKVMNNMMDYDRRQKQAKKRGKKFKKKKATDDLWQFVEKKLG